MLIVIEGVLGKDEVRAFRERLDRAQWQDGARTAGEMAREAKSNQQIADEDNVAIELGNHILRTLGHHPGFLSAALPRRIFPPRFNRYADGGAYDLHVDSAVMQVAGTPHTLRSDVSATLFLSEPDEYDGGDLQITGTMGAQSVKAAAGDIVLYPATSLHRVTPVTRGARIASFFWVESFVRDDGERTLLYDLDRNIQALRAAMPAGNPQLLELTGIYHNLLRRWAIT